jgi:hypothetical protein
MGGIFQTMREEDLRWQYVFDPEYDLESEEIQLKSKWRAPYREENYKRISQVFPKLKITAQSAEQGIGYVSQITLKNSIIVGPHFIRDVVEGEVDDDDDDDHNNDDNDDDDDDNDDDDDAV